MNWELEFFATADGREPVKDWLDGLDSLQQAAAVRALPLILGELGPAVCDSEYGKPLGGGFYEFRLRHDAAEVIKAHRPDLADKLKPPPPEGRVLLRIFFHAHGDRLILLLGAYDKLKDPSKKRQREEIEVARKRLKQWQRAQQGQGPQVTSSKFWLWWRLQVRRRSGRRRD